MAIDIRLQENLRRVSGTQSLWEDYRGAFPNVEELRLAERDPEVGAIATTYDNNKLYIWDGTDWQEIIGVGGTTNLNSLTDVTVAGPTDGQFLVYNSTTMVWENSNFPAGLDDLTDVTTAGAVNGQFLKYNGVSWVPDTATTPTQLSDLSDIDTTGVSNGNVLVYNSTTVQWEPSAPANPNVLSDLTDVSGTAPTNGQVLTWNNAASEWEAVTPVTPATAINDLTDVTITSAATGEVLYYNGSAWVDQSLATAVLDLTDYKGSYADTTALSVAYPTASGNNWAIVDGVIYKHDGSSGWESTLYEIWAIDASTESELETLSNFDTNNEYTNGAIIAADLVAGKRHKHSSIDGIYFEVLEDDTWSRKDLRMPREVIGAVLSPTDSDASASTGTAKFSMVIPFDCEVQNFVGSVSVAPTGSTATFDVHYEATPAGGTGTTIFSTKPTIDDGEYTTETAATASVLSTTTLSKGGMLHFFIDQVGSTVTGRSYTGMLNVYRID